MKSITVLRLKVSLLMAAQFLVTTLYVALGLGTVVFAVSWDLAESWKIARYVFLLPLFLCPTMFLVTYTSQTTRRMDEKELLRLIVLFRDMIRKGTFGLIK